MADKASRLSEILKQEYQSKGAVGGLTSAAGKRIREKMDFRNVLFGGSGVGSLVGKKIFGKGYSAVADKQIAADKITSQTAPLIAAQTDKLDIISVNSQITAKNSMALPSMARDMNLMKLNIFKLVKLQGGTANTNKTDIFWQKSKLREAEYEQQFNKGMGKTTPSKVESSKKDDSGSGGILGFLGGILGSVGDKFLPIIATAGALVVGLSALKTVIEGIYNWFASSSIGKSMGLTPTSGNTVGSNGYTQNTNSLVNTAAGVGGAVASVSAISGGVKLAKAGASTGEAILDARTTSVGSLANSKPNSTWGKFLKWLATRSPKLVQSLGLRLAQASALATIPFAGWIMAAVQLGFSLWTAYEIYELWKEFNKEEEKTPTQIDDKSPTTNINKSEVGTTPSPANATTQKVTGIPSTANNGDMAQLIRSKFKAAGFSDIQAEAAVANAIAESGLNPNARNNNGREDSVGLFQLNRNGGVGTNHSVEDLKDPNTNIDLIIAEAKKSSAFKNATSIQDAVAAFVKDVERPADTLGAINSRVAIATGGNVTPTQSGIDGSALASNSQSMESIVRQMMLGGGTINNIVNNNGGGGGQQQTPITVSTADVMDSDFGKLLARMY